MQLICHEPIMHLLSNHSQYTGTLHSHLQTNPPTHSRIAWPTFATRGRFQRSSKASRAGLEPALSRRGLRDEQSKLPHVTRGETSAQRAG